MQTRSYPEFKKAKTSDNMPIKWASEGDRPSIYKGHEVSVVAEVRKVAEMSETETLYFGFLTQDWKGFPEGAFIGVSKNNKGVVGSPCAVTCEAWQIERDRPGIIEM